MARLAIHPGDRLAEELKALAISAAELARQLKVPAQRLEPVPGQGGKVSWGRGRLEPIKLQLRGPLDS